MTTEKDRARALVGQMPGSAFWDAGLRAEMEGVALAALASVRREALESAASIVNSKRGETFDLRGIVAEIRALIEKD